MADQDETKVHSASVQELLRAIPKVDEFLSWVDHMQAPVRFIKAAVREVLNIEREIILGGRAGKLEELGREVLLAKFDKRLKGKLTPNFRTVINATGVIIHTNMGRSLLPREAMDGLVKVGSRYSNLEFDLTTGKRGSRYSLVEDLLCELTGAEAGLVVNNNAAAVLLALDTLAKNREVIVSRGQLVEIGGSFRIPEVMEKSGAFLREVGATNRTHLWDYENAINEQTSLLLKVHMSNYRIIGFTSEVTLPEMIELGRKHNLPVMEDLGSGSLVDLTRFGLQKEPTVGEVVKAGVDVVTFSGDKLLGGPQAGLILGKRDIIGRIKKNPLNRALRIDKFTLAGLEAILRLYFDEEKALTVIPTLALMGLPPAVIERRAVRLIRRIRKSLADCCEMSTVPVASRVGGGAMPEQDLPSRAVALRPVSMKVTELERKLRETSMPVIGRIENEALLLDMRTVADDEIPLLAAALFDVFEVEEK
ncbi:MAG: L-seryl-tRNA(Sec) selenium transferase [Proteobacteria bacterium]|nr:L-seryl-tRNA(Sec) selenium transferase [Pseudomonadota bacterium]MBU4294939.1 L-seryl-tRNA(Sec) selenium transferase [Pseudomonadota bacterium]MCG2747947.1 L-seryl-tRNA(Sec) selenium transferase [Desulfobulbaceae bacterium]